MSVKDRPKLGRGLNDVSRFFLTQAARCGHDSREGTVPLVRPAAICICHPASPLIQSAFTANLALETARNRRKAVVWDCSDQENARLTTLMGSLLEVVPEPGETTGRVGLYGLPEIVIHDGRVSGSCPGAQTDGDTRLDDGDGRESLVIVNACPTIEFFLTAPEADEYVVITGTGEKALLQSYAFIRVIGARSPLGRVSLIFDHVGDEVHQQRILQRFCAFVLSRTGRSVRLLGALVRDDALERSIAEGIPLVLQQGPSEARRSLAGICALLIGGHERAHEGAGS
jgi:hypothetical protein